MQKFVSSHLVFIALSGFVSAFCLIRIANRDAQPIALFAVVFVLSTLGLFQAIARLSRVISGRTVVRKILQLSAGRTSCEFSVPSALHKGRLLLFFDTGADALDGAISLFCKPTCAEKRHILTQPVKSNAIPVRIPSWMPVGDRGVSYWLRSWRAGSDFRPVVIGIPEPVKEGSVLEIQLSITKFTSGAMQPMTDDSKSLSLVLKEMV
jgi:hypothetical protein